MTEIFGKYAPLYYEKNIPVIPLWDKKTKSKHGKVPIPEGWQAFKEIMPPKGSQKQWLTLNKENNIGLVLGPQSGIVVMDIDTDNEELIAAVEKILPPSPWSRVGKKGKVLAYKYTKHSDQTFRIKENGATSPLVEFLSCGAQVVLPPSIHPDTQEPYTENRPLLEVLDRLVVLPEDIEKRLRDALSEYVDLSTGSMGNFNPLEFQSRGSRDTEMIRMAGLHVRCIRQGTATLREALDDMQTWCEMKTQNIEGDPVDVDKGRGKIIEFLHKDIAKGYVLPVGWDDDLTKEDLQKIGLSVDDDDKEWTYDQIMKYLVGEFEGTAENDPKRHKAIEYILNKLARSPSMTTIEVDRVLQFIKEISGEKISIATYRKRLRELQAGEITGDNHTEIAQHVVKDYKERKGELRCANNDIWVWMGDHWKQIDETEIWSHIAEEYGDLAAAKRASDHKGIIKVLHNLLPQQLHDVEVNGVNFANGLLTDQGEILEHHPKYGMTYVLPYRYMPELAGKFPKFEKLLHDFWGKDDDFEEKKAALQEAMCTTMFGLATSYQMCFLLYGKPGAGKSQLLEIVKNLVPPAAQCAIPPSLWNKRFQTAGFFGKILNVAGELPERGFIAGSIFKEIVTGETISLEKKNKDAFPYEPKAAHWFSSNYLPRSRDVSDGFYRRWLMFDFQHKPDPDKVVRDIWKQIVEEEIEAIAAWAVDAMPRLRGQGQGYTLPASHSKLLEATTVENSTVRYFLRDCEFLKFDDKAKCKEEDIYNIYTTFCIKNYLKAVDTRVFAMEMMMAAADNKQFEIDRAGGITNYVGIKCITSK